jgi:hypothetical protein
MLFHLIYRNCFFLEIFPRGNKFVIVTWNLAANLRISGMHPFTVPHTLFDHRFSVKIT